MNEMVIFDYVRNEYDDGETYLPARYVSITHNQEERATISELLDSFKEFASAIGYMEATLDKIKFVESEAGNEENV